MIGFTDPAAAITRRQSGRGEDGSENAWDGLSLRQSEIDRRARRGRLNGIALFGRGAGAEAI